MNKVVSRVAKASVFTGCWAYGVGLQRVPENWRGHLPEYLDIPSMASNIAGSIALISTGVLADRCIRAARANDRKPERHDPIFSASGIVGAVAANAYVELQDILHEGLTLAPKGEMRDFVAGITATTVGAAYIYTQEKHYYADTAAPEPPLDVPSATPAQLKPGIQDLDAA